MGASISCVIPTIGRPTLPAAIASALEQFDEVIVISDGVDINWATMPAGATCITLGRAHGNFGAVARNTGAYLTRSDWMAQLDDDDEWTPDAVQIISAAISRRPDVDVWLPGIALNNGANICIEPGLRVGNVAMPITRPATYWVTPYRAVHATADAIDFGHIEQLEQDGHTLGWIGQPIYLVRP